MGVNELIQYIRDNFEKKYAENIAAGLYDARDLERFHSDDTFVRSYIRGRERLDEGVDLVHSSFKFRKEFKVNDLCEEMFDRELMDLGAMYFHARDVNRNRILWLKVKLHRKDAGAERLITEKQGIIYALEKAFNEAPLSQVVVLLDMTSCGLANLDMDFVKYIITIFKYYYPTFLAYMLIYDMPWIFNAAWKVVKAWLSAEAAAKIKFVTKADIQTYVKGEDLPAYMGGTDDFQFVYTPGMGKEPLYPDEDDKKKDKKVHFQEVQEYNSNPPSPTDSPRSFEGSSSVDANTNANGPDGLRHRNHSNHTRGNINNSSNDKRQRSLVLGRSHSTSSASTYVGRLLTVSPADELTFQTGDSGEAFDVITLSNILPFPVAFKVKTTSPEKFRVRPSAGIIKPDRTEEVYVYLVPEHTADVAKDKFLIMAMEVPQGGATTDPNQLFKEAPKDKVMQHKLKCSAVSPSPTPKAGTSAGQAPAAKQEPLMAKLTQESKETKYSKTKPSAEMVGPALSFGPRFSVERLEPAPAPAPAIVSPSPARKPHLHQRHHLGDLQPPRYVGTDIDSSHRYVGTDVQPSTRYIGTDIHPTRYMGPYTQPSARYVAPDDVEKQVEQLENQTRHMQRQLNVLLVIQFLTAFTLILVMLSYSCFGEDLFTHFLALPFDFCHDPYGRKC